MRLKPKFVQSVIFKQVQYSTRRSINTSTACLVPTYEENVKKFRWNVPEYFNFSRDVIDKWAESDGYIV